MDFVDLEIADAIEPPAETTGEPVSSTHDAVPKAKATESINDRLVELLQRFSARVRAQVKAKGLDRHGIDPDEVEQEIRIRLWSALRRHPQADLPYAYIQRVLVAVLVDALRRAQTHSCDPLTEQLEAFELVDQRAGPEKAAEDAQMMTKLSAALAALSPRRRRPVQLHLQGFTLQEVADLNGLSLDAARKLIYRGLTEVRNRLTARWSVPIADREPCLLGVRRLN